jgi:hypothetical protein
MSLGDNEMKSPLVKLNWLDRAIQLHNYHVSMCKTEPRWTIEKTAQDLNRSLGSVSQDLTIASWVKTHAKQLRRFKSRNDALHYIKVKKAEMRSEEIDI